MSSITLIIHLNQELCVDLIMKILMTLEAKLLCCHRLRRCLDVELVGLPLTKVPPRHPIGGASVKHLRSQLSCKEPLLMRFGFTKQKQGGEGSRGW